MSEVEKFNRKFSTISPLNSYRLLKKKTRPSSYKKNVMSV